jgi:hypothetical protein
MATRDKRGQGQADSGGAARGRGQARQAAPCDGEGTPCDGKGEAAAMRDADGGCEGRVVWAR